MRKYRVVIRAFTLRRDIASAILFATFLEKQGCNVIITSCRDFNRTLCYWKPDAVIIGAVGLIKRCHELAPDAAIILWPGEGANYKEASDPMSLTSMPGMYEKLDLVLLWGKATKKYFHEIFPSADHSRLVVCGNPRLEFVKYNINLSENTENRKTIGFIGRYHSLNRYNYIPTIFSMQTPEKYDGVAWQMENYNCMINIIHRILKETDYCISIRPHPLEAPEGYHFMLENKIFKGRVEIDDSYDLAAWTSNQKLIIAPSSTSFFESYLMKVPLINMDPMTGNSERIKRITPFAALSQTVSYQPKDYDEVIDMIKDQNLPALSDPAIDVHLDEYHNWFSKDSAIKRAADAVFLMLSGKSSRPRIYMPKYIVDFIDRLSFNRIHKHDPLHTNFNYYKYYHTTPEYYSDIIDNISIGRSII